MKHLFLLLTMLSICNIKTFAQVVLDPYYQHCMVGVVDDFIKRFNGESSHPDIKITDKKSRHDNLKLLFDVALIGSENDRAEKMVETVIKSKVKLNFEDTTWFAMARCNITLYGKTNEITIFLNVEHIVGERYKWVITKVIGTPFDVDPANANQETFIKPNQHDIGFMELGRITNEQPKNIKAFMRNDYQYDATPVFLYLVHSNVLKINRVDDLEFIFTQVPGYIFQIKKFDRENSNSGWLITSFYESDPSSTEELINSIINPTTIKNNKKKFDRKVVEDIYNQRLNEKIFQMRNYINQIQDTSKSIEIRKTRYAYKLKELFVKNSKVRFTDNDSVITLSSFCDKILNNQYSNITINYVTMPILDLDQIEQNLESNTIATASELKPLNQVDETKKSNQKVEIYKVNTYKRMEWLPKFGDIVVTIKRK